MYLTSLTKIPFYEQRLYTKVFAQTILQYNMFFFSEFYSAKIKGINSLGVSQDLLYKDPVLPIFKGIISLIVRNIFL